MKSIFYLFIALIVLSACQPKNQFGPSFKLTTAETLDKILSGKDIVSPEQALTWLNQSPSEYQLIDLRPAAEFTVGHYTDAINIPVQYLFDPENQTTFHNNKTSILQGSDQLQANGPWLLLQQIGVDNVKIMQGGYDIIKMYTDSLPGPLDYVAEQARYDFPAIFKLNVQDSEQALKAQEQKPRPVAPKVVPKKAPTKKEEEDEEGGC